MIKFRAWDKKTKCYWDVEHINFVSGNIVCDMGWADKAETQRWNALLKQGEYILEQSTGLFDMNGVEIFEGDIVKYNTDDLGVISTYLGGFIVESYKHDYFEHIGEVVGEMKIIGNIHENGDLLSE